MTHLFPSKAGRATRRPAGIPIAVGPAASLAGLAERTALWLFIAALAWAPFCYGGNTIPAWGINAVLFPGLALLHEVSLLGFARRHAVGLRHVGIPAALFAAVMVWIVIQNAMWVPAPLVHPIWGMAGDALGEPVRGSISINRDLTELGLLRLITAASVFWLALQLSRNGAHARLLVAAIAAVGAGYAAYGLLVLKTGHIGWLAIPALEGLVSSTFVNRHSYATYAGLGLVATAGLLLQLLRERLDAAAFSWRHRFASLIDATGGRGAALVAGGFLILAALLLTGSRGGVISAAAGLFVLGVLASRRAAESRAASLVPLAFGVLLIAAIALAFGDLVASQLAQRGISDANRLSVFAITLRSIVDKPLLGFGYGTFIDVFPMYRDGSISIAGTWGQAHDTYLEVLQGLGLPFGSLLIGAVGLLALRCAKGAVRRRRDAAIPQVAAAAAALVLVHALVDFSLQMQAVTVTFMALLGAGVAQSASSRIDLED